MRENDRSPCYRCPYCPIKPDQWGEGVLSVGCARISNCIKWDKWFVGFGWKAACRELRKEYGIER